MSGPCPPRVETRRADRRRWAWLWAIAWVGLAPLALAEETEDELSLLFSSQLRFDTQGIPVVTVGLYQGARKIWLWGADGMELTFTEERDQTRAPRVLILLPRQRISVELGESVPGEVRYFAAVESLPFDQRDSLPETVRRWEAKGQKVQVFELGTVFGIQGHVIDNRSYVLAGAAFPTEKEAQEAADRLYQKHSVKTFVHPQLIRRPSGKFNILDAKGRTLAVAIDLIRCRSRARHPLTLHEVELDLAAQPVPASPAPVAPARNRPKDKQVAGVILLTLDQPGRLAVVNELDVERLLQGLIPAEIPTKAPLEALKAQAVVARGELLAKIGSRHFLDPFRICSQTHCQVYSGVAVEDPRTNRAVRATRGELLFRGRAMVDSVYSASCGGHTEDNDAVWSDPPNPALRGQPDTEEAEAKKYRDVNGQLTSWLSSAPPAFCGLSSFNRKNLFRWEKRFSVSEISRLVAAVKPIGPVASLQVLERGVSGRAKVLRIVGAEGELVVQRELPIRQLLGNLKSALFEIVVETDEEQMPRAFLFKGGGWGHGVGMCQIGAIGMAERGHGYRGILGHYYGGAEVFRLYGAAAKARLE